MVVPYSPFLFPATQSTVLPDPSNFFSPNLLASPLPTNSFFQNFALNNGDQPEYFHPYLFQSSNSSLSLSYPSLIFTASVLYQVFLPDLTISASSKKSFADSHKNHSISSFSDLSVTLDLPSSNLRFFLVRGSPFVTASVIGRRRVALSITTTHAILSLSSQNSLTKHIIKLNNNQTWLIYSSSPMNLNYSRSMIVSYEFSGVIRVAALPDSSPKHEAVLDRFSSCSPVSGDAIFTNKPFNVEYKWKKKGIGELLMLAHPLHLQLLSKTDCPVRVLNYFKYRSIDGDLVGVVGDSWVLKSDPISVTWYSAKGIKEENRAEIISKLREDVKNLSSSAMNTNSSYYYGKRVARGARLALVAEEVSYFKVIPKVRRFLRKTIQPWLDGTFEGNGFLYEKKWGGIVTEQGSTSTDADFGFGIYNDHHFHIGYFLYGIAVLTKIDPAWGKKYRPQAYSLVEDFMNLGTRFNPYYPRLRCFDLYKLHSWAAGLTEFPNGRNQESTSEAVNAYYSAALMGMAYGDKDLIAIGSTLLALEMRAAQTWWHVKDGDSKMYGKDFTKENRIVGILWANKRDSALWWASAECRECRLGIQLLPLLPISEKLFSNVAYAKELVEWTGPAAEEGWKGFLYALEGIYDREDALKKIRKLEGFDDGNSFTNLLWWIHSRGG